MTIAVERSPDDRMVAGRGAFSFLAKAPRPPADASAPFRGNVQIAGVPGQYGDRRRTTPSIHARGTSGPNGMMTKAGAARKSRESKLTVES